MSTHGPRWAMARRMLLQSLGVVAVGVTGFVSLGTSCEDGDESLTASRSSDFEAADEGRLVRVRVYPENFERLVLDAAAPVTLEQVDPPVQAADGSVAGSLASGACAGLAARLCIASAPRPGKFDYFIRVGRGAAVGAFSVSLQATLTTRTACDGTSVPLTDLRIDDAN